MKRPNSGSRENCKLLENGRLVVRMTLTEALQWEARGKCRRTGSGTWEMHPQPSGSEASDCTLTVHDTRRVMDYLSGEKLTQEEWERYAGYGLIQTHLTARMNGMALGAA